MGDVTKVSPKDDGTVNKPTVTPPVKSEQLPAEKKLTRELVLAKSKAGSLVEIKKIVVWGQKITDCSIVTEIPDLEVASMTANRISSLEHFGQCPNLRELYLRNNCIRDIAEIYHLKDLPNLQILWLAGNPCTKHQHYRSSVVRNLEQLQTLDDAEVTQAERELSETAGVLFEEPPSREEFFDVEKLQPLQDEPLESESQDTESTAAEPPATENSAAELQPSEPEATGSLVGNNQTTAEPSADQLPGAAPPAADSSSTTPPTAKSAPPAASMSLTDAQTPTPLPRYALAEVRTAVLRLIRLLDNESLELVLHTVRSRLAADTGDSSGVETATLESSCDNL